MIQLFIVENLMYHVIRDVDKIKDPTDYYRQKYADKLRAKAER
jgi:hypothetical protein